MAKREMFPSPSDFPKEKKEEEGVSGLPHTEESMEEKERVLGGDKMKQYLDVEDIPNWFTDTAEEREDEKSEEELVWEKLVDDFKTLNVLVQQELLQDMQAKMKRNFFKTKQEMIEHLRYLVDKNLEVMRKEEARSKRQRK